MKINRSLGLSLGLLIALPLRANDAPTYPASEAKKHVGETVSVTGKIAEVHETSKGNVFLDFDASYPDNDFTAVIFVSDRTKFGEVDLLEGKTATVTGKIKDYQGKPEVVLNDPSQLKVASN